MATSTDLGTAFVHALAAKDYERIAALLHPDVDFRGVTPNYFWEARGPEETIEKILRPWFPEHEVIEAVESVETGEVVDRLRVGYRFRSRKPEGLFATEQQAYYTERDGRIDWMRVVCSGPRPLPED